MQNKINTDITAHTKRHKNSAPAVIDLWQSKTDRPNDFYRIPALAVTQNGTLLALSDLRYNNNSDLGNNHRIDLLIKQSCNNGADWSPQDVNITNVPLSAKTGYGDAAIVADRESDDVLILCASGNVSYQSGTKDNHLKVIRFVSHDGGTVFEAPKDITDHIYGKNTSWVSLFFASGRIVQSRCIKTGTHFRIYAALLSRGFGNAVLYSDNFGSTWNMLGAASVSPAPDGDEPKVEELPDGSVLLSSRKNHGRFFNIFTYTDYEKGTGSWESRPKAVALGEAGGTNGEILLVKARKTADKTPVYLLFQSIPAGPDNARKDITIYWREIDKTGLTLDSLVTGQWKSYLVQSGDGAYSTMMVQRDGGIGFLYERSRSPGLEYDIAYTNLPINIITGGAYEAIFLGTGSAQCPYTDLKGGAVSEDIKRFFAEEKTH